MPPKLARGMDPLACLASDEDEEEEEKEEDEEGERNGHAHAPLAGGVKAPAVVDYEALQRAGYRGGPSVLFVPEKKEAAAQDWSWSRGAESGRGKDTQEALEALHHAAGAGVQESIERQLAAAEQTKRLREAAFREELELRQRAGGGQKGHDKDKLSFNQREKRKRERGQATSGKNYVEEEKRAARAFGHFSGFDT